MMEQRTEQPDAAKKAKGLEYESERDLILEEARARGVAHWTGNFYHHLEKKLRSIGCVWPELWIIDFRIERCEHAADEGIASQKELQFLAETEATYGS